MGEPARTPEEPAIGGRHRIGGYPPFGGLLIHLGRAETGAIERRGQYLSGSGR